MRRSISLEVLFLLLISFISIYGQNIDMNELIKDTQRSARTENHMTFLWWFPSIFWETTLRTSNRIPEEEIGRFIKSLDDYIIFEVIDGDFGPMGAFYHSSEEHIIENFHLELGGAKVFPLDRSEVNSDVNNFLDMMKPMVANAMGEMGKGMKYMVFNNKDNEGRKILDPKANKTFKAVLDDKEFTWRLPIGSLLPKKYDPITKEEFPGNYNFNPYSGAKLKVK